MILLLSIALLSCSMVSEGKVIDDLIKYEDLALAPELSNTTWINADQPLPMTDLRGKVVLLEMRTFG